mmetsp:Transcript_42196/g.88198  ORF Transcript_42196/g.88198 Transcript_42196/m.88198 type:complete len:151 (-) Transcript_42196:3065-3517(-)
MDNTGSERRRVWYAKKIINLYAAASDLEEDLNARHISASELLTTRCSLKLPETDRSTDIKGLNSCLFLKGIAEAGCQKYGVGCENRQAEVGNEALEQLKQGAVHVPQISISFFGEILSNLSSEACLNFLLNSRTTPKQGLSPDFSQYAAI